MWATFFGGDEPSEPFSAENPAQDVVKEEQYTDGMEESPMFMLLKRMNQLLVQVGELEFEKKSVAEKAEKDIKIAKEEITRLKDEIDDLNAQNGELIYQCEASSDPVLLEQMQDLTDMRDALVSIRNQLEIELDQKQEEISTMQADYIQAEMVRSEVSNMFLEDIRSMVASEETMISDLCGHLQLDYSGSKWTASHISSRIRELVDRKSSISPEKEIAYAAKLSEWEDECERQKNFIFELQHNLATQSVQTDAKLVSMGDRNAELEDEIDALRQAHTSLRNELELRENELISENERLNQQLMSFTGNVAAILGTTKGNQVTYSVPDSSTSEWLENVVDMLKKQLITKEEELCSHLAISAETMKENAQLQKKIQMLQSALQNEQEFFEGANEIEMRVSEVLDVIVRHTENVDAELEDWESIKTAVLNVPSDGIRMHLSQSIANYRKLQTENRRLKHVIETQKKKTQTDHEHIAQMQAVYVDKNELILLLEESRKKVTQLQESQTERRHEMVKIEEAMALSRARNVELEEALSTLEFEFDAFRTISANQIQELSDAKTVCAIALKNREEEIGKLESSLDELRCQLEVVSSSFENKKHAILEGSQKQLREELGAMQRCLETERSRNLVLAAEFDTEKASLLQQVNYLEGTLNEKEELNSKSLEQLGELEKALKDMETELLENKTARDLERTVSLDQIHLLETEVARKEQAYQSLQASAIRSDEYDALESSYRQMEADLQQSKIRLEAEKERNLELANALEDERASVSKRISFLEATLSDKDLQLQDVRVSLETMAQVERNFIDAQQQNTHHKSEIAKLTTDLNNSLEEKSNLISEKRAFMEQIRLAEEQIGKEQAVQISLKEQLEAIQANAPIMLQKLEHTRSQINSLTQQKNALETSTSQLQEVNEKYQSELHELGREMQAFRQQARAEIQRLTSQNTKLEDEIGRFARGRLELDSCISDMQLKYEHLKAERDVLAARSKALEEQLALYTDIPSENASSQPLLAPDLWELLSKGMEQLKADLEVASKHAASIDDSNVMMSEESVNAGA